MIRRSFLHYAVGMMAAIEATAQSAILKGNKALACEGSTTKCPLGHETCRNIDAPIAIGNDNRNYPDVVQMFAYRILTCSVCGIVFTEKQ